MLTGKRAFVGEDISDTLATVLKSDPEWNALPVDTPVSLRQVLRACLRKDPKQRIGDMQDVRLAMEGTFETTVSARAETPTLQFWQKPLPAMLAALGLIIVAGLAVWSASGPADAPQASTKRFALDIGPTNVIGAAWVHAMPALSPDGTLLAYAAHLAGTDAPYLYLRSLDELAEPQRLAPTEDWVWWPFFSPDGESVGFFDTGLQELKRVSVRGGPPTLLDDRVGGGGTWLPDGWIITSQRSKDGGVILYRIPETGGTPEPLTTLEAEERAHVYPHALPGGEHVLFTRVPDTPRVAVLSLETGERDIVVENGYDARYVATGHLIFGRDGALWGVPFDLERLDTAGSEQMLVQDVSGYDFLRMALAASDEGTLVYLPTSAESGNTASLVWVNRQGQPERIPMPDAAYLSPTVLPEGNGIAYYVAAASGPGSSRTLDLERNVPQRLAIEGQQTDVRWSPNGRRFAFSIFENGRWDLRLGSADGSEARPLPATDRHSKAMSWSADGEWVVFTEAIVDTGDRDIWVVRADGSEDPHPLIATPAEETQATVSPNGRWIAYRSDDGSGPEILVESFPSGGNPRRLSASGGTEPVWSKDGRELYYRTDDYLMAVPVSTGQELQPGRPAPLFEDHFLRGAPGYPNYDVARDGRFLMVEPAESGGTSFTVVVNSNR